MGRGKKYTSHQLVRDPKTGVKVNCDLWLAPVTHARYAGQLYLVKVRAKHQVMWEVEHEKPVIRRLGGFDGPKHPTSTKEGKRARRVLVRRAASVSQEEELRISEEAMRSSHPRSWQKKRCACLPAFQFDLASFSQQEMGSL